MNTVLYSTGCPRCKILEDMLTKKGVSFEKVEDKSVMINKGFMSAPMLVVGDKTYDFVTAMASLREILYNSEG